MLIRDTISRRQFIGSVAALVGVSALPANVLASGGPLTRFGIQLYTLRDLMAKNVPETLKAVAALGFTEVEFAGYFDHGLAEIKVILDGEGLTAPSAHFTPNKVEDIEPLLKAAEILDHHYLVAAIPPNITGNWRDSENLKAAPALYNRIGQVAHAEGRRFGFHNHDSEFALIDGRPGYDRLLEETDPAFVSMELDLFWITKAGHNPLDYFSRYPGRFHLCHVKDMAANGTMVEAGRGTIDFARIFARSGEAGLKHYFIEHDNPQGNPLATAKIGADYLKQLIF